MSAATIIRRPMPATVPDWELEPLAPAKQGFAGRLPPVTEAERLAGDRARNTQKPTPAYFAAPDRFDLEQQIARGVL